MYALLSKERWRVRFRSLFSLISLSVKIYSACSFFNPFEAYIFVVFLSPFYANTLIAVSISRGLRPLVLLIQSSAALLS